MIAYRDFVPEPTTPSLGPFKVPEFETFEAVVAKANEWIQQQPKPVKILNVETVVLPHVYVTDVRDLEETRQTIIPVYNLASWQQFVRVWYETG